MRTMLRCLAVTSLTVLAAALPAAGEVWIVTLTSGQTFESRYQPEVAPWDDSKVLLMTDVGNWIGIARAEITAMEAEVEKAGFGRVIDTHTIALGASPNDLPVEGEGVAPTDPTTALLQYIQQQEQQAPYSVEQFVEPDQASGIPLGMVGGYSEPGLLAPGAITQPPPPPPQQ